MSEFRLLGVDGHDDCRIAVLGLGHVGLPTALGLADLGWKVVGADQDARKVSEIAAGRVPFFEPGVDVLLSKHLASGRFTATSDVLAAVREATVIFLCVGTPQRQNGEADLSQVESIARLIGRNLDGYKLIVEKSTVPAITAQWIKRTVTLYANAVANGENGNGNHAGEPWGWPTRKAIGDFDVASNPEFIQEGKAIEGFFRPNRIVLGVESPRARETLETIYRPLQANLLVCDLTTAELIKYASNAFLAMKISYINLVAEACDAVGADVNMVARGIGMDKRIGPDFLNAGLGFGGYCFPKDLRAFIHLLDGKGVDSGLLQSVENINLRQVEIFLRKLRNALWVLNGKSIGILGLAFKPGTDDVREAASLRIINSLLQEGASVRLYDPQAIPSVQQALGNATEGMMYCSSPYEAAAGTQALLLVTEWDEFRDLDWSRVRELMEVPIVLDGRNFFDPETIRAAGFEYIGMGRGGDTWPDMEVGRRQVAASTHVHVPAREENPSYRGLQP
ncbi:MAG: UDP-glucose/GDP-mannose dehydrogenase family protein [Terriglobia bacterium]